jgi:hypothetical protein
MVKGGFTMLKRVLLFSAVLLFVGCASNVYLNYPYPDNSAGSGRVIVKLTEAMEKVNVKIDGSLVAEDKHTGRVEIQSVPFGERLIEVAASEYWRTKSVNVEKKMNIEKNKDAIVLIDTPPYSGGYWAFCAVLWLVAFSPSIFFFAF